MSWAEVALVVVDSHVAPSHGHTHDAFNRPFDPRHPVAPYASARLMASLCSARDNPFEATSIKGACWLALLGAGEGGLTIDEIVAATIQLGHDWSHAKTPYNSVAASLSQDFAFVRLAPKQYTLRHYSAAESQAELGASEAAACAAAGAELSGASLATLREAFSLAFGHGTPRTKNRQWLVQRLQAQGQAQGLPPLAAAGARACPPQQQPLPPRQHKLPSRLRDEPAAPGAARAPPGKRAKASKDAVAAAPVAQPQRRLSTLHPAQRGSLAPLARMALPCGTTLSPGDDVFLLTPKGLKALHSCAACAVEQPGATAQLLECERCLRGFHLTCVQLPRVPAGAWICPDCAAMPGQAACVSDMQRFDQGLLFLAQVVSLWWDPSKQAVFFRARWYHAPPEKTTRWWLPGLPEPLREVALGPADDADVAGLGAVLRRALVVRPERAKAAAAAAQLAGDPMPLVCHRGFNPRKGTFMPLNAKRDKRR